MIKFEKGKIYPKKKVSEGSFGSLYTAIYISNTNPNPIEIALKSVAINEDVKQEITILKELSFYKGFANLEFIIKDDSTSYSKVPRVYIGIT
jgi:hypothetical protein